MEERMTYETLKKYGLSPRFEEEASLYEDLFLARITEQHRDLYKAICEKGEIFGEVSGKFAHQTTASADFPAPGDWVMVDKMEGTAGHARIHHVLRRKSVFERQAAGTAHATQVVAANIDVVFLCMALSADFNLRRLERYLSIAWGSRATPVIVLTKADLCTDLPSRLADIATVGVGTEVLVCSSVQEGGYEVVRSRIKVGETVAFIGSSGVGKSTLINRMLGEDVLATREIREDDGRGRHTTTHRQLLLLPHGGLVIDTPGMRELHLDSGDLSKSFEDIDSLAARCRYRDCSHQTEPGCAVREAIENGTLAEKRFENYRKLQKEIGYAALNSRQLEHEKIKNMFGGLGEMKQALRYAKGKNGR